MAIANINEKTGIAYGVIQGNSVPELLEEIFQHGQNLTYDDWKARLTQSVRASLNAAISDFSHRTDAAPHVIEETVEALLDSGLNDDYEAEEEEFIWDAPDNCRYKVGWLGGAPLIWVLFSPWVTEAHRCSPCVPNAGNLDSPCPEGVTCYCVAPEWLPEGHNLITRFLPVQAAQSEEAK